METMLEAIGKPISETSLFHFDALTCVMLGLIALIGTILLVFSKRYLAGDPGFGRFRFWLIATLLAVATLVSAGNLLLLAAAWVAISLSLHQLLTFYKERPGALIAAHKKFIASRAADLCLLAAILMVGSELGSFDIADVQRHFTTNTSLALGLEVAATLFVLGACLKCAQLPFHGWLMQVMEAPTPVSALLHAGIVNIGGFLMIRLSPLMIHADFAQTLLVVIGTGSAVAAALVMMTQSSIKVTLAWSTCAQMGFMLIQCGLGAYELALLHLIAHSLYKAHAFLSSGSAVESYRASLFSVAKKRALQGKDPLQTLRSLSLGLVVLGGTMVLTSALALSFGTTPASHPVLWTFAFVLALALTVFSRQQGQKGIHQFSVAMMSGVLLATLYFTWHSIAETLATEQGILPSNTLQGGLVEPSLLPRLAIVLLGFSTLFALQGTLLRHPRSRFSRAIYPLLYEGFYLDAPLYARDFPYLAAATSTKRR